MTLSTGHYTSPFLYCKHGIRPVAVVTTPKPRIISPLLPSRLRTCPPGEAVCSADKLLSRDYILDRPGLAEDTFPRLTIGLVWPFEKVVTTK
jgi:hypothetical protein